MIPVNEPLVGQREVEYVTECVRSGWISSSGRFIQEFEEKWAAYCGMQHAVAMSNGTTALQAAAACLMIPTEDGRLIRITSGSLDVNRQLVTVHYTLFQHRGKRVVSETSETHRMRFFFPLELELLLEAAGLELVALRCFGDLDREPDEQSWNTIAVVQR
jgi:hypothetical protein